MRLLLELSDKDLGIGDIEQVGQKYTLQKAVRAVLFNAQREVGLEHVKGHGHHKLPGGGIEIGEELHIALKREVREEMGVEDITIGDMIGVTIEYRNKYNLLQICYCYFAEVNGAIGEPSYDAGELEDEHEPVWMPFDEVVALLESEKPEYYNSQFIVRRELAFLREAKRMRGDL